MKNEDSSEAGFGMEARQARDYRFLAVHCAKDGKINDSNGAGPRLGSGAQYDW
jgi:hypothetical protein